MEVIMYIGDIIKAFREEHQLSQETFAAKAGLTVSEINTLEQNFQDGSSTPVPVAIRQIKGIAQAMEQPMPVIMSQIPSDQQVVVNVVAESDQPHANNTMQIIASSFVQAKAITTKSSQKHIAIKVPCIT